MCKIWLSRIQLTGLVMPSKKSARRSTRKKAVPAAHTRRHSVRPRKRTKVTGARTLYPEIKPHRTGYLRVSNLHEIYFEESGNPQGKPALFVHGGPGAGADARARRFFDPE